MGFSDNLKSLMTANRVSKADMARYLDINRASFYQWETGVTPRLGTLEKIAKLFGVSVKTLTQDEPLDLDKLNRLPANAFYPEATSATVPLVSFGAIHAGEPIEPIRDDVMVEVPAAVAEAHPSGYLLQVVGNCMNRRYPEGCHVLIDPDMTPQNGQAVAVQIDKGDVLLRVLSRGSSTLMLVADSFEEHEDMVFSGDSQQEVELLGVVVWFQADRDVR